MQINSPIHLLIDDGELVWFIIALILVIAGIIALIIDLRSNEKSSLIPSVVFFCGACFFLVGALKISNSHFYADDAHRDLSDQGFVVEHAIVNPNDSKGAHTAELRVGDCQIPHLELRRSKTGVYRAYFNTGKSSTLMTPARLQAICDAAHG